MSCSIAEQVGQPNRVQTARILVAVDRLAEQRYLQAAVIGQTADLVADFRSRPALLRPADPGHDAVGAKLVAAEHRPHHRLMRRRPDLRRADRLEAGEAVLNRLPTTGRAVETHLDPRPAAAGHLGQQDRQPPQLPRPHHQVHVGAR